MKKCLILVALLLSLGSFAKSVAPWDLPLQVVEKPAAPSVAAFIDPYVTDYSASTYGSGAYRKIRVYMTLDRAAIYYHKMTVKVTGNWQGTGVGYKYYDVIMAPGQAYTYTDFPLAFSDNPYVACCVYLEYDGPQ